MKLPITIKECNGVALNSWPILVIVPLPEGQYQDTGCFRVADADDNTILSQVEVLNRWWGKDNSIRHLRVQFFAKVDAYQKTKDSGIATYYLCDDETNGGVWESDLEVNETVDQVHVYTGAIRFSVDKTGFAIRDVTLPGAKTAIESGYSVIMDRFLAELSDEVRRGTKVEIEETGPVRVVIRISAPTTFVNPENHLHGFCVRLYAYAGLPFIQVEYQLQNSDYQRKFSWPYYFKACELRYTLPENDSPRLVRFGLEDQVINSDSAHSPEIRQLFHDSADYRYSQDGELGEVRGTKANGFMDISSAGEGVGVTALCRYFWQQWPNGLRVADNRLTLDLWPEWSRQWIQGPQGAAAPYFSDYQGYWLDDMCHMVKKTGLFIHDGTKSDNELLAVAKTFDNPPAPSLSVGWYKETAVSLDLDGQIPTDRRLSSEDKRQAVYSAKEFDTSKSTHYNFGWDNYRVDVYRKWGAASAGGWPYSVSTYYGTGNPADLRHAEAFTLGELNVRPQWLPIEYQHERDYSKLKLTQAPYAGQSWRAFDGQGKPFHAAKLLEGTISPTAKPRDDEHAWFYHVLETYYLTGDYWIKDWYSFIAEFRRVGLLVLDAYPDKTTRAKAHRLAHAIHAYQVTGKPFVLDDSEHCLDEIAKQQWRLYGCIDERVKVGEYFEQTYELGYFARALIAYLAEVPRESTAWAKAFNLLSGCMEWNLYISKFAYRGHVPPKIEPSRYSSQAFADPQAWFYWHTGKTAYLDQLREFAKTGINNEANDDLAKLSVEARRWAGDYHGRFTESVLDGHLQREVNPPPPITDLTAEPTDAGVLLSWTPTAADGYFHLVYADKPIVGDYTNDPAVINWWAADALVVDLKPARDVKHHVIIPVAIERAKYFAIFTFNEVHDMSEISNNAVVLAEGAKRVLIEATWQDANSLPVVWTVRWKLNDGQWEHVTVTEKVYSLEVPMQPKDKLTMQVQASRNDNGIISNVASEWSDPAEFEMQEEPTPEPEKPATPFGLTIKATVLG